MAAFSITVVWDPVQCPNRRSEIVSYTVYYGPLNQYSESNRSSLANLTNTSVVIVDVMPVTAYAVQVVAVNREGLLGPPSVLLSVTTSTPRKSWVGSEPMWRLVRPAQ